MVTKNKLLIFTTFTFLFIFLTKTGFSEESRQIPENLNLSVREETFNSVRFQSGIRSDISLSALAKEHSIIKEKDASFGFAAKSDEAKFFLIGSLYSESLAHLHSGEMDLAAKSLEPIEKEFINLNVPVSLYNYIVKTRALLENGKYQKEILIEFLSLFQTFFEDYARNKSMDKLSLFRAGAWLANYGLSAASGDVNLLRQPGKLNYFIEEMKKMDAPKGVLDNLNKIFKLSNKKEITRRDTQKVLKLVKKIQIILG